jgi:hypothetical protein
MKGGRKISRVKWSVVCKEKNKGGLGVCDIRLVNLSLLAKWRWCLLLPGRPLWKEVLAAKYGNHILCDVDWSRYRTPSLMSNWWKNIIALDKVAPGKNWLLESIGHSLGNGNSTSFWNTKWIGDTPLAVAYPRLFSLSNHKDKVVRDFLDTNGSWVFSWRRNLFLWEEELVDNLIELLESVVFTLEEDCWKWLVDGDFSVKSAYNLPVEDLGAVEEEEGELVNVLRQIWDSPTPSKVIA